MANIVLDAIKTQGTATTFVLNRGDTVTLEGFDLSAAELFINELGQLVILLPDGTEFLLSDFAQILAEYPDETFIEGVGDSALTYSEVIARYLDFNPEEVEPALGPETTTEQVATQVQSSGSSAFVSDYDTNTDSTGTGTFTTSRTGDVSQTTGSVTGSVTPIGSTGGTNNTLNVASSPNEDFTNTTGVEETPFLLNIPTPTDPDSALSDLVITVSGLPTAQQGVISLFGFNITVGQVLTATELQNLTFTPAVDFNGSAQFTYTVNDGESGPSTSVHTINVTGTEDFPSFTGGPSSVTIDEDADSAALNLGLPTDPDTPYGDVLTIQFDTDLTTINASITLDGVEVVNGQTFTVDEFARLAISPDADFNGVINLNYTASDLAGNTASNTHAITVSAVNDAPTVTDSSSTQDEDSVNITLNIPMPTDAEGDVMFAKVVNLPTDGTLRFADGSLVVADLLFNASELPGLTFTPNADYNGTVNIQYTVTDGAAESIANHEIIVGQVNDWPNVADSASVQDEDSVDVVLGIPMPTDVDGDILTAVIDTLPSEGILYFANGDIVQAGLSFAATELTTMTFTPNANYNGTVSFSYLVSDGIVDVAANHTVTVNAINDAPDAIDSTSTQAEDSVEIALNIATPLDVDGDVLTARIDTLPTDGIVRFADGTAVVAGVDFAVSELLNLTFTPNADFTGAVNISYTVSDGEFEDSATHTVTVTDVNDWPVVVDSSSTQDEDSDSFTLGIPLPTDVDDAALIARVDTLPLNGILKFANGTLVQAGIEFDANELAGLTFTPDADFNGVVTINYAVNDGVSPDITGSHTATVTAINDAPVVTDSSSIQSENSVDITLDIPLPTDVDGDALTALFADLPANGTLNFADSSPVVAGVSFDVAELAGLTFTPNADFTGTVTLNYTVSDGTVSQVGTHTITVNPQVDFPGVPDSSSAQDEDIVTDLNLAIPVDVDGDPLTATITSLPTNGTLTFGDGSLVVAGIAFDVLELADLTFAPDANFNGVVSFTYDVTDGVTVDSSTHTITVNSVNDAPTISDSTSTQLEESVDVALGISAPTDVEGDTMLATITSLPADGTVRFADGTLVIQGVQFAASELTGLTFTPNMNFSGDYVIEYEVSDGMDISTATHTVTVTNTPDFPVVSDSSSVQDEDSVGVPLNIPQPTDPDIGDVLTARIDVLPTEGALRFADGSNIPAGVEFNANLLTGLIFTPNADYNGTVNVLYTVSDGTTSLNATHTITVTSINDAPVVDDSSSIQAEDSVAVTLNIPTPTDVDGDILTATINTLPVNGVVRFADGNVVMAGQPFDASQLSTLTFTPNAEFVGNVQIVYSVSDGTETATGVHTVTVSGVNDAPVVTDSTSIQAEDSAATALNITAPVDLEGDVISVRINTLPTEGTLNFANGSAVVAGVDFTVAELTGLTFTPNADFNGDVVINYVASDGMLSSTGTHTVTVTPVNDAPVGFDSTSTQAEDSVNINMGIAEPTDVDGDVLRSVIIEVLPTEGTIRFANGTEVIAGVSFSASELPGLTFTPNADFNGSVSINYNVLDGIAPALSLTHTVTVTDIPDAPVAVNSSSTQAEDSVAMALNIPAPTDGDGDVLSVRVDSLPGNGTLRLANGSAVTAGQTISVSELEGLTFTPSANFNGSVSFNYTVSDGSLTDSATHRINVTAVNDAPVAENSTSTQEEDTSNVTLGIPTPTDVDGDALTARILALPADGTLRFANGDLVAANQDFDANLLSGITFTPTPDFYGQVIINYSVSDGSLTDTAAHTITVTDVSDAKEVVLNPGETYVDDSAGDVIIGTSYNYETVSYENSNAGVNVNLETGRGTGGFADDDTLLFIDNLVGSDHNDTLIGDRNANVLDGGAGSDSLVAQAGNDTLIFDEADSNVDGGAGFDTLIINEDYSFNGNNLDLSNVKGIEVIDMHNHLSGEKINIDVTDLLSTAENNEVKIIGNLITDFDGTYSDDKVQLTDKTINQIKAADKGEHLIDGVVYDVLDFGAQGTLYIENKLDILDSNGNYVNI